MSFFRQTADQMRATSAALARWEIEAGRTILGSRRRLVILALFCLPAILFAATAAAGGAGLLPDKIPVLGGSKALMPSTVNDTMFFGSILVGLVAGLITGVIGAGGGYILTPALMSFGVRGIMAVGTDQFHLFAKAIMGTTIHRKLGNVNVRLAAWFVVGSFAGVTVGGNINRAIFQYSPALSDAVISLVYVLVLGFLGFYAVADWLGARRNKGNPVDATTPFAQALQRLPLRPRIIFDRDVVEGGRSISVYPVILCGLIVGFVAAIMGVGGGFLTFPMFVYGLGVSTFTTVGTDILQIIFTTAYSSIFQYAIYGFVFYTVAVGMLLGSLVGVQIGALVTTMVSGAQIRAFFALTILAGFANRLCALPRKLADLGYISLSREVGVGIETVGTVIFFAIVGLFSLWILAVFFRQVAARRAAERSAANGQRRLLLAAPRRFALGLVLLVSFFVVLVAMFTPAFGGRNLLAVADGLFNSIAKGSVYNLASAEKQAAAWVGTGIDIGVHTREFADKEKMMTVVASHVASTDLTPDGRVRVTGDLGKLSQAALADAAAMFANDFAALERQHQRVSAPEALYCWWLVFDGLSRRYVQENRGPEAAFTRFISAKVLEPAYNFRGIAARRAVEAVWPLAGLLVFYLAYTIWYGIAIMLIFEGLGIGAAHGGEKKER
ncbi:MAG: sulfite exporter TauE/SafE family protein [Kiritimatiellales bacterium]